ncbi:MAG: carbohydrate ABC transporter substrate-binding protein [Chloroflexia bacterium]|nr:carbohydrate ABC transporter substrate-binding protein [Chloroflexia bacterium]
MVVDLRTKLGGRASRRNVLKGSAAVGAGALGVGRLGGFAAAQDASPTAAAATGGLEVFSWWTSPGEAPALQALFDTFNGLYPDVEIVNAAVAGGAGVNARAVLITRLQGNQPPDSWQTHVGRELIDNYVAPGFCEPVTDIYESEGLLEVMPQTLIDQASQDSEQYSVPVGVHRGNGFWYNRQVMEENGVTVGETMSIEEFLAAAETLQTAGITPLSLATRDTFAAAQTFENTLLAVAGPEKYNQLFLGEVDWDDADVRTAADTYAQMLQFVNEDHPALSWDQATAMVIEGRAGFNSMGDWAYGEVVARDAVENTGWVSHPGTNGSFVLVVDSFTLPVGAPDVENARNWLRVLGSREAQEAFNPLKGSIPARTDIDREIFSPYHQWSIDSFANDALVPSCAHGQASSPAFQQAFYDALLVFVDDQDADSLILTLQDAAALDAEMAS